MDKRAVFRVPTRQHGVLTLEMKPTFTVNLLLFPGKNILKREVGVVAAIFWNYSRIVQ
jgi:hypothetical protein